MSCIRSNLSTLLSYIRIISSIDEDENEQITAFTNRELNLCTIYFAFCFVLYGVWIVLVVYFIFIKLKLY